jgi:hypothetical protein
MMLSTAFPGFAISIDINPALVAREDQSGFYASLSQFGSYIYDMSRILIGGNYPGVDIVMANDRIVVSDNTAPPAPRQLDFQDLIGQPTWIDPLSVQFKCPMRADLSVLDYIKFPPALVTSSAGAIAPSIDAKTIFQGTFRIRAMRHVGNFRQPDAASWVTIFNAFSVQ